MTTLDKSTEFPRPNHKIIIVLGWVMFGFCLIAIAMMSMTPMGAPPSGMHLDKLLHAIAYGALTFGLIFALPKHALPILFSASFIYGAIIEVLQGTLAEGRTASAFDAIANGVGAMLIILIWIWVCPRLKQYLA